MVADRCSIGVATPMQQSRGATSQPANRARPSWGYSHTGQQPCCATQSHMTYRLESSSQLLAFGDHHARAYPPEQQPTSARQSTPSQHAIRQLCLEVCCRNHNRDLRMRKQGIIAALAISLQRARLYVIPSDACPYMDRRLDTSLEPQLLSPSPMLAGTCM